MQPYLHNFNFIRYLAWLLLQMVSTYSQQEAQTLRLFFGILISSHWTQLQKWEERVIMYFVYSNVIGVEPFISLVDGGRDGIIWKQMLEYFFFAQLKEYVNE